MSLGRLIGHKPTHGSASCLPREAPSFSYGECHWLVVNPADLAYLDAVWKGEA